MIKPLFFIVVLLGFTTTAQAETVVTVDDSNRQVTVQQQPSTVTQTVVATDAPVATIVPGPYNTDKEFEGDIVNVDLSENQIIVRDTDGREHRMLVKQGMISNYKVDDRVRVEMMNDGREARMIRRIG